MSRTTPETGTVDMSVVDLSSEVPCAQGTSINDDGTNHKDCPAAATHLQRTRCDNGHSESMTLCLEHVLYWTRIEQAGLMYHASAGCDATQQIVSTAPL